MCYRMCGRRFSQILEFMIGSEIGMGFGFDRDTGVNYSVTGVFSEL